MVYEMRKQSMAWMEHGLQIYLKRYPLSMEDKMAAGDFWTRYELWVLMDDCWRFFVHSKVRFSSKKDRKCSTKYTKCSSQREFVV